MFLKKGTAEAISKIRMLTFSPRIELNWIRGLDREGEAIKKRAGKFLSLDVGTCRVKSKSSWKGLGEGRGCSPSHSLVVFSNPESEEEAEGAKSTRSLAATEAKLALFRA